MSDTLFVVDRKPMETRIPMEYRTDDQARRITLCKRKKGLCKKAEELAQLCGIQVAVCIVGDGCKPAQMVATGSGAYHDIASCHQVMTEYSAQVKVQEIDNPTAAVDSRKTLVEQRQQLERQRREIVLLRRQLADARGGAFDVRPPKKDHVRPRKRGRSKKVAPPAVVSFSCFSQTLLQAPPSVSGMTVQDPMMLTHPTHDPCWLSMSEPIGVESTVVESSVLSQIPDGMQDTGNIALRGSVDVDSFGFDFDSSFGSFDQAQQAHSRGCHQTVAAPNAHHARHLSGEWSTDAAPAEPQIDALPMMASGLVSIEPFDLAFGTRHKVASGIDVQATTHEGALYTSGRGSANEYHSAGAQGPAGQNPGKTDTESDSVDDVFEAIVGSFEHCLSE